MKLESPAHFGFRPQADAPDLDLAGSGGTLVDVLLAGIVRDNLSKNGAWEKAT